MSDAYTKYESTAKFKDRFRTWNKRDLTCHGIKYQLLAGKKHKRILELQTKLQNVIDELFHEECPTMCLKCKLEDVMVKK